MESISETTTAVPTGEVVEALPQPTTAATEVIGGVSGTETTQQSQRPQAQPPGDRVRANTSEEFNQLIDQETDIHVRAFAQMGPEEISRRIRQLDQEWDMERTLETNASLLSLTGIVFSLIGGKKWLILPGLVMGFLFQHATQGWCPPVPLLRRLGVRTRKEIDQEKYALKAMRGDFAMNESLPRAEAALQCVKAV